MSLDSNFPYATWAWAFAYMSSTIYFVFVLSVYLHILCSHNTIYFPSILFSLCHYIVSAAHNSCCMWTPACHIYTYSPLNYVIIPILHHLPLVLAVPSHCFRTRHCQPAYLLCNHLPPINTVMYLQHYRVKCIQNAWLRFLTLYFRLKDIHGHIKPHMCKIWLW